MYCNIFIYMLNIYIYRERDRETETDRQTEREREEERDFLILYYACPDFSRFEHSACFLKAHFSLMYMLCREKREQHGLRSTSSSP